ncbi:acyltransferase family protein [Peribacillus loiseleuriae]|uniref:Acetyltransferase n=1 Tax=Peribacillus loiseleuriae TaxID=1679170 RepID=A0A0K9GXQ0_9BACI|nr:acyltransferase [Peribacillus loiseleuriae]KMY51022.1 acetyltransferase [Peribacillus loiseleuriae]
MTKRYEEFDSLRGLAALIVLIGHYMMVFPAYESYNYELNSPFIVYMIKETPLRLFLSSGNESVILFFLLSGFVLYLSINNTKFHYSTYIIKRICRIYIPYLVAIIISILAKVLLSHNNMPFISNWFSKSWTTSETPTLLLQHLFFIGQYNTDSYNNVIWSLVHEMRISILFPLLIFLFIRKKFRYSLVCFIILSVCSTILLYLFGSSVKITSNLLSFHYITIFLMGSLLAKYRHVLINCTLKMKKTIKILLLAIAITCFMYEGIVGEIDFLNNYIFRDYVVSGGVCILMILSLASLTLSTFLRSKALTFLGKISFSLYLYHLISLFSFMYLFYDKLPTIFILILSFFFSFLLSFLAYLFVEKPCINLGRYLTRYGKIIVNVTDTIEYPIQKGKIR